MTKSIALYNELLNFFFDHFIELGMLGMSRFLKLQSFDLNKFNKQTRKIVQVSKTRCPFKVTVDPVYEKNFSIFAHTSEFLQFSSVEKSRQFYSSSL